MLKAIIRMGFVFAAVFCLMAATFFVWFGWQHGSVDAPLNAALIIEAEGIFVLAGFWYLLAVAFGVIYWRARRW